MTPQLNQENLLVNTGKDLHSCIDFNRAYDWFQGVFIDKLTSSSKEFLAVDIAFYLLAITEKPSIIWQDSDYFVTQVEVAENSSIYIRISNTAAQVILDTAFGKRANLKGELKLKNITELEARILTAYNEFLFTNLDNVFQDRKNIAKIRSGSQIREDLIHLTFCIYSEEHYSEGIGKIIFSIPEYILKKPELVSCPEEPINVFRFSKSFAEADIFVGKSKIALDDLKNLEAEDILILESSNLHSMTFKSEDEIVFKINPDPRIVVQMDNSEGGQTVSEMNSLKKNIWDSLQVEVGAEFKKIKMTLGDLKQITEGLVVDLAPIVQNEIFLHVEGNKIAAGELVIIGDKYGVKITEVFQETKHEQETVTEQAAMKNEEIVQEDEEDHHMNDEEDMDDSDFDYSDFEIEDDI